MKLRNLLLGLLAAYAVSTASAAHTTVDHGVMVGDMDANHQKILNLDASNLVVAFPGALTQNLNANGFQIINLNTLNLSSIGQTATQTGDGSQIYISVRTDGSPGKGTKQDPYDASTSTKLETLLAGLPSGTTINAEAGVFLIKRHDLSFANLKSNWTIRGAGMYNTIFRLDPSEIIPVYGGALFTSRYNLETNNVVLQDLTLDTNWPAVASSATVGAGSNTFSGKLTSGSPIMVAGSDVIYQLANGGNGFTPTDITRVLTATGIPPNTFVSRIPATSVGAASDSVTLPQSTINVVSTTDFSPAGTFFIVTSTGDLQYITYTGKTATTFTGCTGGNKTINGSNLISTLSQVVMSQNATVSNGAASVTIGGEREGAMGAAIVVGSNNTFLRVRSINTYGSGANGQELFALLMGVPSGTDGQLSNGGTNNWMIDCKVEQPNGNYGSPFGFSGADDARPISNSGVIGCEAIGINNGLGSGFNTGGVNLAAIENITISNNIFLDCSSISYQDTGSMNGLFIHGNKLIRGQLGVGLATNGVTYKKNVWIFNNRIIIQNRTNGGGNYAIGVGPQTTTNLNIQNNSIGFDYGGLGLDFSNRFIYGSGITNGNISYNTLDTDGNGTMCNSFSNVRIVGNLTLSTGTFPSNPDGGISLVDSNPSVTSNTSTSVVNEIALFADTAGKILKRSTGSGITKLTSGVLGIATAKTDYWDTSVFGASGGSHAKGLVPDSGSSAGTTKFLREDATWQPISGSAGGTVTDFSIVTANGISGSVANSTSIPAVTLTLGAITPISVSLTGTAGTGVIQFPFQTSTVATPSAGFSKLYVDVSGMLSFKGPAGFAMRFSNASLSANRTHIIQDKDGTFADTSDLSASVTGLRKSIGAGTTDVAAVAKTDFWDATVFGASGGGHSKGLVPDSPSSAGALKFLREDSTWTTIYNATTTISASDIDWSTSDTFSKTLAANITFTFSNTANKTIVVAITNTINNYTVTWPVVKWTGGTSPTQTTGVHTDVYTFVKIGSTIYGSVVPNF